MNKTLGMILLLAEMGSSSVSGAPANPRECYLEDYDPSTRTSRVIREDQIVARRAYLYRDPVTGLESFRIAFEKDGLPEAMKLIQKQYSAVLSVPECTGPGGQLLSPVPLLNGTILDGTFFGFEAEKGKDKYLYTERLVTDVGGKRSLTVDWNKLSSEQAQDKRMVILFLKFGWVLNDKKEWKVFAIPEASGVDLPSLELTPVETGAPRRSAGVWVGEPAKTGTANFDRFFIPYDWTKIGN